MDRLWKRPDTLRLFALAENLAFDGKGNARDGEVYYLEKHQGRVSWCRWVVGECLHWHGFRIALLSTPRAGLHLVSEWRPQRGDAYRYTGNHHLHRDGVLVLSPCNALRLAEPLDEALADAEEERHLDDVLRHRFNWDAGTTARLARVLPFRPRLAPPKGPGWERAIHPLAPCDSRPSWV